MYLLQIDFSNSQDLLAFVIIAFVLSVLVYFFIIKLAVQSAIKDIRKDLKTMMYASLTPEQIKEAHKLVKLEELRNKLAAGNITKDEYYKEKDALLNVN